MDTNNHLVVPADFEYADKYGYLPVWTQTKRDWYCECITINAIKDPEEDTRYWFNRPTEEDLNKEWEE